MFSHLSKFNCVSETNQTSNQNFPTLFFRESCQEDIAILNAFSRSNPTGNELDYKPLNITRYIRETFICFTLVNKPS